jgi:hypothetical protein
LKNPEDLERERIEEFEKNEVKNNLRIIDLYTVL